MSTAIVWFRNDLRLADQPALRSAAERHESLIPVYVHAPEEAAAWAPGAASNWWLHHSLESLDRALRDRASRLLIRTGPSVDAITSLAIASGARAVYWNRAAEPAGLAVERALQRALGEAGVACHPGDGSTLFPLGSVSTGAGAPFRVFTPFWRACERGTPAPEPLPPPPRLPPPPAHLPGLPLGELGLLPRARWDGGLARSWVPGEAGARERLSRFTGAAMAGYGENRDRPDLDGVSKLSPHLHFGEISPREVMAEARRAQTPDNEDDVRAFTRQLGWREFACHLLFHFPRTTDEPLNPRFGNFPWMDDERLRRAWERGETGYPLVDAGMRELWETGWMHNRVRMVAASFLTKNCLIHWREGARWFWDTLVDADLANNTLGWQWVAGSGADAAPYFRVFNPVRQSERFDPAGRYIRRWIPELARLPDRWLHAPWAAPAAVQQTAGVRMDRDYPRPIVDLRASRERALAAYNRIRGPA